MTEDELRAIEMDVGVVTRIRTLEEHCFALIAEVRSRHTLLRKYMDLVGRTEGVTFVDQIDRQISGPEIEFTDVEREELLRIDAELRSA